MNSNSLFKRILLPGLVIQSVLIGGGYATGRELVEFFLSNGPAGGLAGMLLATVLFSLISMASFEFARMTRSYDYRSFFSQLLGKAWILFEIGYLVALLLILAVIGAASGEIVAQHLGASAQAGQVGLMVLIGFLVFWGTAFIERFLAGWSFLLYATYGALIFLYLARYGDTLAPNLAADALDGPWIGDSLRYVGYNVLVIPLALFCTRHMETRRDALLAGSLAGPIAMVPAILFFLGMATAHPEIVGASVPADFMIQRLGLGWIEILFYVVVFGTFVETGTAMIHAINERIARVYAERGAGMPRWLRPTIALTALVIAIYLAGRFGIVDLIARGYTMLAYFFIVVIIVPLFTVGLWRIFRSARVEP